MKLLFLAVCLMVEKATVALQNSDKGWRVGWTWGGRSARPSVGSLADEDMVSMLYTRSSSPTPDHPSLYERMEYRKAYEVTENPAESDYGEEDPGIYQPIPHLDNLQDPYQIPDNTLGSVDPTQSDSRRPYSSSSSTFMSASSGDVLRTEYSHQIIHH